MNDFSGLAYGVHIFSQYSDCSERAFTNPTEFSKFKNEYKVTVNIGKHVITGAKPIVSPGVNLPDGCFVVAMTLVNKSTDPAPTYLGNSAKLIKRIRKRKKALLELEQRFLEEYK